MTTMGDVARLAGVSASTVSHVLNGTRNVDRSTRLRVEAAIEKTGTPVTVIGEIVKSGLHVIAPDGQGELPAEGDGWDHFAS